MRKILIIKTGYSEILEGKNNSRVVSLGDVLRTTPLLHAYKDNQITWLADPKAFPLLEGSPFIQRLIPYDFTTSFQLMAEEFDTVINLEKLPGICALSDNIRARRGRFGFSFNTQTGEAEAYDLAYDILAVVSDPDLKKQNKRTSQELLFEMVGKKWMGEEYLLGYQPKNNVTFDVGLNTLVGVKWPNKAWPIKRWDELEEVLLKKGLKVTRQDKQNKKILQDLKSYIDWINSSKIIITNDSLGLHLGIALKKEVIGLFGPTPHSEVYFYGRGEPIASFSNCKDAPCFSNKCFYENACMEAITIEEIISRVGKYTK